MKHTENILDRLAGGNAGQTVPDGFFESFKSRMAASLPQQDWESQAPKNIPHSSRWQRIRPYVYLAAMFMGIWCMMKMFDLMRPADHSDIESNPVLVSAIDNDALCYYYCLTDLSEPGIYDDLYNQGIDPYDLSSDAE